MTEDQVAQLSALGRDMEHVMRTMQEIKSTLQSLPTKADVDAMVSKADHNALAFRVDSLEKKVADNSPAAWIQTITRVAVMITAIGAAVGLLGTLFVHLSRVA